MPEVLYRTRGSRVMSLFSVSLAIFLALLVFSAVDQATPGRLLLVAGPALAAAGLALAYRSQRISLRLVPTGLEVRNFWRTWSLAWDEVSEIGTTMLTLAGGRPVVVVGIATTDKGLPQLGERVGTDLRWFFSRWSGPGIPVEATAYPNRRERTELESLLARIESGGIPIHVHVDQL